MFEVMGCMLMAEENAKYGKKACDSRSLPVYVYYTDLFTLSENRNSIKSTIGIKHHLCFRRQVEHGHSCQRLGVDTDIYG